MAKLIKDNINFQTHPHKLTVTFDELTFSPFGKTQTVSFNESGASGVRRLKCAWSSRIALARDLMGYVRQEPDNTVHIYRPATMPGYPKLVCNSVDIEPYIQPDPDGDTDLVASFVEAIVTANYAYLSRATPEDQPNITYVSEELNPAAEFITLPNDSLFWDAENTESLGTADAPGYLIRMMEWQYTLHKVFIMPPAYFTLAGSINNGPVFSQSLNFTFEPGTLLADAPSLSRQWTSEGLPLWDVTFRFLYRPQAQWNLFPRPNIAGAKGIVWNAVFDTNGIQKQFYTPSNFGLVVL